MRHDVHGDLRIQSPQGRHLLGRLAVQYLVHYLPRIAHLGNPWEVMHKILNGQPGEQMPALRALDHQIIADVMAHMTTLPQE